uniref:Uncharacterized protein n=1 Tax=Triticum urartu TaxID=4572 RepID=A0A8R7VFZ6_TRIUA
MVYLCVVSAPCLVLFGMIITAWISIFGLMEHDYYGDTVEGRTNMDPAHNLLYVMCMVQGALFLYRIILLLTEKRIVKQVSQSYGFQDGDPAVSGYLNEIRKECFQKPSSVRGRNLITYAVQLMESNSPRNFLSGTLILERLLTRQHLVQQEEHKQQLELENRTGAPLVRMDEKNKREEMKRKREEWKKRPQHQQKEERIIIQQSRLIKRLIFGSASSSHILEKLLQTLDSRDSYNRKMREAAMRILEQLAGEIRLEQFPRWIQCISSLINTFEEYHLLQAHNTSPLELDSESDSDVDQQPSSKVLACYKELVLTGLSLLWSLAGNEVNCEIIINAKHVVYKIMAPVSYDLVHRSGHSAWSTMAVERSLGVMLQLIVTSKENTREDLRQWLSKNEGAIATIERIVTCEECKYELKMKGMQILSQLSMDENASRDNLTKTLINVFIRGDNGSIRKTAGKTLLALFLGSKSTATLLPKKENDVFVGQLAKILVQDDNICRKIAAEILEHLCVHYTENTDDNSTLKEYIIDIMPQVLKEILYHHASIGEGIPGYAKLDTDVESQSKMKKRRKKKKKKKTTSKKTSSSPGQNQHHKLHPALLSLCVTACNKYHLDLDTILREVRDQATDPEEYTMFSLATKMVQLNRGIITTDSLTAMKLTTRMVIAEMQKLRGHGARINLESLMDSLSSASETMLDLEGSMVFATEITMAVPATADTLDSLVKKARQLHREMKHQDSEIEPDN